MAPTNAEVARMLQEYADLLTLEEGSSQAFRVRAYDRAVAAVRELPTRVADMTAAELQQIAGVGASTATKIREYVDTGAIAGLEALRLKYPQALVELMRIPGMGPKTLIQLREVLGVETLEDLEQALAEERLRHLPGLGARSEEKIARAIQRLGLHGKERRTPIIQALGVALEILHALQSLPEVRQVEYCGSLRRFQDTIGDVDIVVASNRPEPVMAAFVALPVVSEVLSRGDTKAAILTRTGLQVDLRVVEPGEFGAAILYFTGSKAHNIELRQLAMERGWILNEYALADAAGGEVIASRTEKAIYQALGLAPIPPELREGVGEIRLAATGGLPHLLEERHIKGDLHVHSTWSGDGRSSLEAMIAAAASRGLEYVAITEHGENLAINGLSRDEVREEREVLAELAAAHPRLTILHGAELNIGADGRLDYDQELLTEFDFCVASVHSHFDLDQARQTDRLLTAIANPAVSVIGHLTGRRIGKRPGIELDAEAVFAAAAETDTALEINSHLDRLDVPADMLRKARLVEGLTFAVSTDSHHTSELANMRWGVHNARRGWIERTQVVNTLSRDRFLRWVDRKRRGLR